MAKLVEILARELKEWKDYYGEIHQECSGLVYVDTFIVLYVTSLADDWPTATVTRAQWEAERARIANEELMEDPFPDTPDEALKRAANRKSTQEAREIARTGSMTSEEQELSDIACGKRSKEDQTLWDKVASESLQNYLSQCDLSGSVEQFVERAYNMADAFMAERAKRMKGV